MLRKGGGIGARMKLEMWFNLECLCRYFYKVPIHFGTSKGGDCSFTGLWAHLPSPSDYDPIEGIVSIIYLSVTKIDC